MKQNPNSSKSTTLALLVLLFILPGCLAYIFYQHPQWINGQSTNHGQIVTPFLKLEDLDIKERWQLMLLTDSACDAQCLTILDKLGRVRLALGRLSREVDLRLVVANTALLPKTTILKQMEDMAMASQVLSDKDQKQLAERNFISGLFIVDPRGYMVLSYPMDTEQKPIFKDLKHLLKVANQ